MSAAVPVIAIDGPSASGKGVVAHRVAESLGFHYLDSGAIYRAAALAAVRAGLDLDGAPEPAAAIAGGALIAALTPRESALEQAFYSAVGASQ